MKQPRKVFVISDLHLGGVDSPMMSKPNELATFIRGLDKDKNAGDDLELVVAGDFIDFLAIEPYKSWTPDPTEAVQKLTSLFDENSPFHQVFGALKEHVEKGYLLTILLGNHDIELALPSVQEALLSQIQAEPYQVKFVDNGHAYRLGRVLIEHGNRYDDANINDWSGIRAIASAQSRFEPHENVKLTVSTGSQLVEAVFNPLKLKYPFIDLLQPQGSLVAFLLLAFEPSLKHDWKNIASVIYGNWKQQKNKWGEQPTQRARISASTTESPNYFGDLNVFKELAAFFGVQNPYLEEYQVGFSDWMKAFLNPSSNGLYKYISNNEEIPQDMLEKIRRVLLEYTYNRVDSK